jgi:hypothetical protein
LTFVTFRSYDFNAKSKNIFTRLNFLLAFSTLLSQFIIIMDNQIELVQSNSQIGFNNSVDSILSSLTDPPKHKNIDPSIIKTLYDKGYSSTQIGKALKISNATVFHHLNKLKNNSELNKHFVANRVEILQNVQRELLTSIEPEEIKKTPIGSRVLAFSQLYDKERIETNQSSSNININLQARLAPAPGLDKVRGRYLRASKQDIPTPLPSDNTSNNLTPNQDSQLIQDDKSIHQCTISNIQSTIKHVNKSNKSKIRTGRPVGRPKGYKVKPRGNGRADG